MKRIRAYEPEKVKALWDKYQLPENMEGLSFLDVGCWANGFCLEAKNRGAEKAFGIDIVRSPSLVERTDFIVLDIFSEKYLGLPIFDVVLCAGVLYHVENPISLLYRLKLKTKTLLVLETEVIKTEYDTPMMTFCLGNSYKENYSIWWVPNAECVRAMLEACEFEVDQVYDWFEGRKSRACFHAQSLNKLPEKILPRKKEYMDS